MEAVKVYLHTADWYRPMFLILGSVEPYGSVEVCQGFQEVKVCSGLSIIGHPKYVRMD
jgi:hypothetical protein